MLIALIAGASFSSILEGLAHPHCVYILSLVEGKDIPPEETPSRWGQTKEQLERPVPQDTGRTGLRNPCLAWVVHLNVFLV